MTDNLSKIIEHHENSKPELKEDELNVEIEEKINPPEKEIIKEEKIEPDLQITNLSNWFNKQLNSFSNINHVKVDIRGIDPYESIIVTIPDYLDPQKRKIKVIENANTRPVLNYKAIEMNIYNSGYSITYLFPNEEKVLRCYGVKTGIIISHCQIIDENNIPYFKEKVFKDKKGISFVKNNIDEIKEKLNKNIELESILILYPQLLKEDIKFKTNLDAIIWFNKKREKIMDINHLIKIDTIIMDIIKN